MNTLLPTISDGQPYVDEPVYLLPRKPAVLEASIMRIFGTKPPSEILIGHERIRLRWMKPGPGGTLIPR